MMPTYPHTCGDVRVGHNLRMLSMIRKQAVSHFNSSSFMSSQWFMITIKQGKPFIHCWSNHEGKQKSLNSITLIYNLTVDKLHTRVLSCKKQYHPVQWCENMLIIFSDRMIWLVQVYIFLPLASSPAAKNYGGDLGTKKTHSSNAADLQVSFLTNMRLSI